MPASIALSITSLRAVGSLQDTPIPLTPLEITSSITRTCSAASEFTEATYNTSTVSSVCSVSSLAFCKAPLRPNSNTGLLRALGIQANTNLFAAALIAGKSREIAKTNTTQHKTYFFIFIDHPTPFLDIEPK